MAGLSETFTEELEQLLLASELTLLPGIYFFNPALHLAGWALAGPPKLIQMLPAWRPQLSFRCSARRSCSLRVDFLVILEFSIRSGFRELKNTDFKPKGPARILVRAIAADPTRTRSLNSPFQALHTQLSSETRKRGPDRLASSAPTGVSGTWSWWKE